MVFPQCSGLHICVTSKMSPIKFINQYKNLPNQTCETTSCSEGTSWKDLLLRRGSLSEARFEFLDISSLFSITIKHKTLWKQLTHNHVRLSLKKKKKKK